MSAARSPDELTNKIREPATSTESTGLVYDAQCCCLHEDAISATAIHTRNAYIQTYVHTYIHTYIHTCIDKYTHTYKLGNTKALFSGLQTPENSKL